MRTHYLFPVFASLLITGVACSTARPSPSGYSSGTAGASSGGAGTVGTTDPTDASTDGAASGSGSSGRDGSADGSSDAGIGPPIDASLRGPGPADDACNISPTGWWTTTAGVDAAVSGSDFANAMNGLFGLPNAHPLTMAAYTDSGHWHLKATGSATNGVGQQYFPFDHAATPVIATHSATAIGTTDHESVAFLHVVDAASQDAWVPLSDIDVHTTIGDAYCEHLESGALTATITHDAGAISVTLVGGSVTTLAGLLGAEQGGGGWPLRMTFDAEKVQITLK